MNVRSLLKRLGGASALATLRHRSIVVVLSDFIAEGWERPLRRLAARHELVAITVDDPREHELPESGWIEMLGAGMVHPEILQNMGIDSDRYTGFAAGMGVERLAMQLYGVEDIRQFYQNDLRMLRQF